MTTAVRPFCRSRSRSIPTCLGLGGTVYLPILGLPTMEDLASVTSLIKILDRYFLCEAFSKPYSCFVQKA
jgi:hypothetical protein